MSISFEYNILEPLKRWDPTIIYRPHVLIFQLRAMHPWCWVGRYGVPLETMKRRCKFPEKARHSSIHYHAAVPHALQEGGFHALSQACWLIPAIPNSGSASAQHAR